MYLHLDRNLRWAFPLYSLELRLLLLTTFIPFAYLFFMSLSSTILSRTLFRLLFLLSLSFSHTLSISLVTTVAMWFVSCRFKCMFILHLHISSLDPFFLPDSFPTFIHCFLYVSFSHSIVASIFSFLVFALFLSFPVYSRCACVCVFGVSSELSQIALQRIFLYFYICTFVTRRTGFSLSCILYSMCCSFRNLLRRI